MTPGEFLLQQFLTVIRKGRQDVLTLRPNDWIQWRTTNHTTNSLWKMPQATLEVNLLAVNGATHWSDASWTMMMMMMMLIQLVATVAYLTTLHHINISFSILRLIDRWRVIWPV